MTLEGLIAFDKEALLWFNSGHSLFLDSLVPILTSGLTWIPLYIGLLYLVVKNNETMSQIALIVGSVALCLLLSGGVDDALIKPLVGRLRPCNDPDINSQLELVNSISESSFSFFSAHAANTMSLCVFFCLLIRDRLLSVSLIIWSLINCWTRLYLGVHYPLDVACGILYGALAGLVVYIFFYKVYYKFSPKLNYISSQYTSTGYSKADIDVVMGLLILTIAVAVTASMIYI